MAVVGWQRNFGRMLRAFDARLPPGSKIYILSEKEVWFRRKDLATEGLSEYGGAIQVEAFLRFKPGTKKGGQQRRSIMPTPLQGPPPLAKVPSQPPTLEDEMGDTQRLSQRGKNPPPPADESEMAAQAAMAAIDQAMPAGGGGKRSGRQGQPTPVPTSPHLPPPRMGPIPGCTGLVNCTLHHRVGIITDEIALRQARP